MLFIDIIPKPGAYIVELRLRQDMHMGKYIIKSSYPFKCLFLKITVLPGNREVHTNIRVHLSSKFGRCGLPCCFGDAISNWCFSLPKNVLTQQLQKTI